MSGFEAGIAKEILKFCGVGADTWCRSELLRGSELLAGPNFSPTELMDVGPVSAIRPLTMVKPSPAAPDLSRVFEAEYLGQSRDDEYTPGRKPSRGLEDEEGAEPVAEETDTLASDRPSGSLSLFA